MLLIEIGRHLRLLGKGINYSRKNIYNTGSLCLALKAVKRLFCVSEKKLESLNMGIFSPGNTKGGSITVPLTSCLTGLDKSV